MSNVFPSIESLNTGTKKSEWYIKKHYNDFFVYLNKNYNFCQSWIEKVYCYFHNINNIPKCPVCGNPVKYRDWKYGYSQYCSYKCSNNGLESTEKRKQTLLKHYGVDNPSKSKECREKFKQTLKEKYGEDVTSTFSIQSIREKSKQTLLKHYGVESPLKSQEILKKLQCTNEQKYGTKWNISSDIIREKSKKTCLERYGDEHYCNREQGQQTNLNLYGCISPFGSSKIREKSKQTLLKHYGVINPSQSPEIKQKISDTFNKKYGGNPFSIRSYDIQEKSKKTCLERYGVETPVQISSVRNSETNDSKPNDNFEKILIQNNINFEREFVIQQKRYDFKINDILIEINPYPTHNSTWGFYGDPKPRTYHQEKTKLALQHGYNCIHIWDWDDINKIINLIKPKTKIYARNCIIKEISKKECDVFLNKYHIQNTCRNQTIKIGLYYNNELIGLMTFGKPRYNKKYQYELLRLCYKNDYQVVGGTEKMFKYFIKNYNPNSIISYCDMCKFSGDVYLKLGFKLYSSNPPSKHWYNNKLHITDNLLKQRGFDQLFKTNYGKHISNEQLMLEHKFVEIYDCGQNSYVWNSTK